MSARYALLAAASLLAPIQALAQANLPPLPNYSIVEECAHKGAVGSPDFRKCSSDEIFFRKLLPRIWASVSPTDLQTCIDTVRQAPLALLGDLQPRYQALEECIDPFVQAHLAKG